MRLFLFLIMGGDMESFNRADFLIRKKSKRMPGNHLRLQNARQDGSEGRGAVQKGGSKEVLAKTYPGWSGCLER